MRIFVLMVRSPPTKSDVIMIRGTLMAPYFVIISSTASLQLSHYWMLSKTCRLTNFDLKDNLARENLQLSENPIDITLFSHCLPHFPCPMWLAKRYGRQNATLWSKVLDHLINAAHSKCVDNQVSLVLTTGNTYANPMMTHFGQE